MKFTLFPVLAMAGAMLATAPAHADVFSSQGFTGETTTLNNLPGVSFDVTPGLSGSDPNCVEVEAPSYSARRGYATGPMTECRVGNFSFSASRGTAPNPYDTTYGGNPPPWEQGWKP